MLAGTSLQLDGEVVGESPRSVLRCMLVSHGNLDVAVSASLHNLRKCRSLLCVQCEAGVSEVVEAESREVRCGSRCCPCFIVIGL